MLDEERLAQLLERQVEAVLAERLDMVLKQQAGTVTLAAQQWSALGRRLAGIEEKLGVCQQLCFLLKS